MIVKFNVWNLYENVATIFFFFSVAIDYITSDI